MVKEMYVVIRLFFSSLDKMRCCDTFILLAIYGDQAPIRRRSQPYTRLKREALTIDITYLWWLKKGKHH
jgi:hypothetical protein